MKNTTLFIIFSLLFLAACTENKEQERQKQYLSTSAEQCNRMGIWLCEEGMTLFSDETGCGCETVADAARENASCKAELDACMRVCGANADCSTACSAAYRECINGLDSAI